MKTKIFFAIVGLQCAWIAGTSIVQERTLTGGTVILLETVPVDPRDLLRGDYVILNYGMSRLPLSTFSPPVTTNTAPKEGTQIEVLLEPKGRFYEPVQASLFELHPGAGQVRLRGTVKQAWFDTPGNGPRSGSVRVDYGLERYYVAEGAGNPTGKLTVEVAVPASGWGAIKQVFLDGKPYAEVMRDAGRR